MAGEYKALYDEFIERLVYGYGSDVAFLEAFACWSPRGDAEALFQLRSFAAHAAKNPYVQKMLKAKLSETKLADMWNTRTSVHETLKIIRDPAAKDTARVAAIKTLNELAGLTFIDDKGQIRAGASLADFYASVAEQEGSPSTPNDNGSMGVA